ncbi:MAG: LuxR C-terminal-related transcriptional regulator [Alloprevotella sp.]
MSNYKETDHLCDIISDEYHLLSMMSRFGIPLGFGEKTVREVCEQNGVDTTTFLAVANYLKNGAEVAAYYVEKVSVAALIAYLSQAHSYFLDFQLPAIRRKLLEAIDCSRQNEVAFLILKFYDEYMGEVRKHMQFENRKVFQYVEQLLQGVKPAGYDIQQFSRSHEGTDKKLQELKNIIIKYYTASAGTELLNGVLFDIFNCEADMHAHCEVEDVLFVPAVERLERQVAERQGTAELPNVPAADVLSDREKEIVGCIVRGMTNKEVAEKLFISLNTVLTHRKNISRKLNIHSIAGLTIYAIAGGLVRLEDVSL